MKQYCVYLTIYRGNKLPPFYIGSTYVENILKNNYRGSVGSQKYKYIWKSELRENPQLFVTKIIKTFNDRKDANYYECFIHARLDVEHNPLYINKKNAILAPYHKMKSHNKNKIVINRNGQTTFIPEEALDLYLSVGWKRGQNFSKENLERMARASKGSKWYNNGIEQKRSKIPLKYPWKLGKLPDTEETKINKRNGHLGKPKLHLRDKTVYINKHGETCQLRNDDPKVLSGEFRGINAGKQGCADHLNKVTHSCVHCGLVTTIGNIKRWHNEKCRHQS